MIELPAAQIARSRAELHEAPARIRRALVSI
ncbi:Protein of unknown function [Thermobacillus xylanilyticus]|uniref:Uncharacterized protein n=1 Tax=Thermobacillus xylanilyticus TaxID=76633 RepID=A0ABM8V275_THEXY|nr:Protein of unknown function [Thermobacillus xylanilyticus]